MLTRQYDRFSTSFDPVPVSFSGEAQGVGRLYDISYGGCKVKSSVIPALGASVTLRFRARAAGEQLVIRAGIVSWTIPNKYFGVKFVELQQHEERSLNHYLTFLNELFLAPEGNPGNGLRR